MHDFFKLNQTHNRLGCQKIRQSSKYLSILRFCKLILLTTLLTTSATHSAPDTTRVGICRGGMARIFDFSTHIDAFGFVFGREPKSPQDHIIESFLDAVRPLVGLRFANQLINQALDTTPTHGNFYTALLHAMRIDIDVTGLDQISSNGPKFFVSPHFNGALDAVILMHIAHQSGNNNAKFVAMDRVAFVGGPIGKDYIQVYAPEVNNPKPTEVDFETVLAGGIPQRSNLDFTDDQNVINTNARKAMQTQLGEGGSIIIFPGAQVSWRVPGSGDPVRFEYNWDRNPGFVLLAKRAKATIVPVSFDIGPSRLYNWASRVSGGKLNSIVQMPQAQFQQGRNVRANVHEPITSDNFSNLGDNAREQALAIQRIVFGLSPPEAGE